MIQNFKQRFINRIKQRQTWGFLLSVVIMAVISIAFFMPDNFAGNDLRQHDMMQGMANGQEAKAFYEATGETTRWTDALFSGMPTFQISPSYPSDSLFSWFTKVYGLGLPAPSNLLFMMMLGFMILMTTLKIRWEYGLIGAIAWGFSTYFIIIIGAGHIWKFVTLTYIPPTIAGVLLAYRGRYLAGGAMAAFFAMMQLCSNHVQMTYYFGFVIFGFVIAYFVDALRHKTLPRWCKATATLVVAAALAICANLPNLYHTSKYAKESQRELSELAADASADTDTALGPDTSADNKDFILQYSYGVSETFTFFIPNVKGGASIRPEHGQIALCSLSELGASRKYDFDRQISSVLQQLPQYFGEPEMTNGPIYVGVIIFALFLLGCIIVKGPIKWTLVVLTLLSVFLAWGRNFMFLSDLFIDIVPLYKSFRTPESILVIAEFTIPLLAIMGLYTFVKDGLYAGRKMLWVHVSFGIVAFFCLLGIILPAFYGNPVPEEGLDQYPLIYDAVRDVRLSMVRSDAIRSLLFLAGGYGLIWLLRLKIAKAWMTVGGIGLLVLVDLYTVNKRYINHDSFVEVPDKSVAAIQPDDIDRAIIADARAQGYDHYRVLDVDAFSDPRRSYFHSMLGGYHAAKLGRYNDLVNAGLIMYPQVFDMLDARYIIYKGEVMPNDEACGNAWFVDDILYVDGPRAEIEALTNLADPSRTAVADRQFEPALGSLAAHEDVSDTATLKSYSPKRLVYDVSSRNGGVVVFSEIYFPWGWTATIDGVEAPIGRVNYVLRAMKVPAGRHEIVMTFDPPSVGVTCTVATIAVILIYLSIIAAIVLPLIRRKR